MLLDKTFRTFLAKPFGRSLASLTATVDVLISQGGTSRTSYLVLFFLQSAGLSFVIATSQTFYFMVEHAFWHITGVEVKALDPHIYHWLVTCCMIVVKTSKLCNET